MSKPTTLGDALRMAFSRNLIPFDPDSFPYITSVLSNTNDNMQYLICLRWSYIFTDQALLRVHDYGELDVQLVPPSEYGIYFHFHAGTA